MMTQVVIQGVKYSIFSTPQGWDEWHLMVCADQGCSIEEACEQLYERYLNTLLASRLTTDTQVFSRIFLSDIANQKKVVQRSPLYQELSKSAVSMIEQPPLFHGMVCLHLYHVVPSFTPLNQTNLNHDSLSWRNGTLVQGRNYRMLWTVNQDGRGYFDAEDQTNEIFNDLSLKVAEQGMSLRDHTVRTWIYVRDIDNHYSGMVKARKELFEQIGLAEETRTIASTGIEGRSREAGTLVSVDALSYGGLKEEQIVRMEAPLNMPSTYRYGVTFERGLRVRFGDRSHLYVSGTASIDHHGDVLFKGDVQGQTERTLDNIQALLDPHHADLENMAYLYVYVRDPATVDLVRKVIGRRVPSYIPILYVKGAVCRPEWLVEIEGVGIVRDQTKFPDFL